jgi:hypothetical protein
VDAVLDMLLSRSLSFAKILAGEELKQDRAISRNDRPSFYHVFCV